MTDGKMSGNMTFSVDKYEQKAYIKLLHGGGDRYEREA